MLWVSLVIIVIFGSATLILQDETFIKWKPSVLYWLFAGHAAIGPSGFQEELDPCHDERADHPARADMGAPQCQLGGFFALMGGANLYVAFNYSTEDLGQFQVVRVYGFDAGICLIARMDAGKIYGRQGG